MPAFRGLARSSSGGLPRLTAAAAANGFGQDRDCALRCDSGGCGGEGMALKPNDWSAEAEKSSLQPALKVRGRDYLRNAIPLRLRRAHRVGGALGVFPGVFADAFQDLGDAAFELRVASGQDGRRVVFDFDIGVDAVPLDDP